MQFKLPSVSQELLQVTIIQTETQLQRSCLHGVSSKKMCSSRLFALTNSLAQLLSPQSNIVHESHIRMFLWMILRESQSEPQSLDKHPSAEQTDHLSLATPIFCRSNLVNERDYWCFSKLSFCDQCLIISQTNCEPLWKETNTGVGAGAHSKMLTEKWCFVRSNMSNQYQTVLNQLSLQPLSHLSQRHPVLSLIHI